MAEHQGITRFLEAVLVQARSKPLLVQACDLAFKSKSRNQKVLSYILVDFVINCPIRSELSKIIQNADPLIWIWDLFCPVLTTSCNKVVTFRDYSATRSCLQWSLMKHISAWKSEFSWSQGCNNLHQVNAFRISNCFGRLHNMQHFMKNIMRRMKQFYWKY